MLFAGGDFTWAGGMSVNRIAKWDGASWSALGGGMDSFVYALAPSGGNLYAGGYFTMAGGTAANYVACWNGSSWSTLGSGMNWPVWALAANGNTLLAGGQFAIAGNKVSGHLAQWQPRVNVTSGTLTTSPGVWTLGNDPYGFFKPALVTTTGTTVAYSGGLLAEVTLDRADEIQVSGKRVNGAFTLTPDGVTFGGDGATVRIEFSEDDATLFGEPYTAFRAVRLTYPAGYPASKEAAAAIQLAGQSAPAPVRIENGRQIYAITAPLAGIQSTYGAVPAPAADVPEWMQY
jgi:hypothetical protein